jgi:hypothetical protein
VPIERITPQKPKPKARKRAVKRNRITNKVLAALAEQNLMTFTAQRTSRINRRCDETGIKDKAYCAERRENAEKLERATTLQKEEEVRQRREEYDREHDEYGNVRSGAGRVGAYHPEVLKRAHNSWINWKGACVHRCALCLRLI